MKKALIIFPDEWISYSPTILNMVQCLKDYKYNVDVIAFDNKMFVNKFDLCNIEFIDSSNFIKELFPSFIDYNKFKLFKLICLLKKKKLKKYDLVIGVDSIGYLAARIFRKDTIFLSLEVKKDSFLKLGKKLGVKHLIIQTEERKKFLFDNEQFPISYVQNSPILKKEHKNYREHKDKVLIYFGNVIKEHGVEYCIESLRYLDTSYKLKIQGILDISYHKYLYKKYNDLIKSDRLLIDTSYIKQEEVIDYLSNFYIGFCFYNFDVISKKDFNYITCPSGKLFNYYASGLPVIANDIMGLKSVNEFNCGILLNKITPDTIANSIMNIEREYEYYSKNSLVVASHYDFKENFKKFIYNLEVMRK